VKFAYLFRVDVRNPGDLYSSPIHYLGKDYNGVMIDAFAKNIPEMEVDAVIIGGGALMTNQKFVQSIDTLLEKIHAKYKVVWGVGFESSNVNIDIKNNFDLFSTREYKLNQTVDWVPCVSALHPVFDTVESVKATKEVLVVDHFKRPILFDRRHTRIINKPNNLENIVKQISNHNFIITSSYHVAYWSILAGKRCAVIGENLPTKFRRMKHFPVISDCWHDSLFDQAQVWPNARYDSILANYTFHRKFETLVGVENPAQLAWHLNLKRDNQ
jgi:hypothetical protein